MTSTVLAANTMTAPAINNSNAKENVHDANQSLCDSEIDFVMIESLIDVDINNSVVELSSALPLHRATVRGQSRHSDLVIDDTGRSAGVVDQPETIDSLGAPSQHTGKLRGNVSIEHHRHVTMIRTLK